MQILEILENPSAGGRGRGAGGRTGPARGHEASLRRLGQPGAGALRGFARIPGIS